MSAAIATLSTVAGEERGTHPWLPFWEAPAATAWRTANRALPRGAHTERETNVSPKPGVEGGDNGGRNA